MTIEELATNVLRMLEAQRVFFRTHDKQDLYNSKRLEAQLIKDCRGIVSPQEKLFGDAPGD